MTLPSPAEAAGREPSVAPAPAPAVAVPADLAALIRRIALQVLQCSPAKLTDTVSLRDDLLADSLQIMSIVAELEERLGVEVPTHRFLELVDLASIGQVLVSELGGDPA